MLEGPGERRGTGEGRRENRTPAHHTIHLWLSGGWCGGGGHCHHLENIIAVITIITIKNDY